MRAFSFSGEANMKKAYSLLQVKSFDAEQRILKGIASTPSADRMEDVMSMEGVKFALPMPFLWQHDHSQPIGEVVSAIVSDKGIEVEVKIAEIGEEGKLKDRIEEAWQSIKSGLVKGLSIGFRGIKVEHIKDSNWGLNFKEWEWFELSAVTVPANAEASITQIKSISKSFDDKGKAALGDPESNKPKEEKPVSDVAENKPIELSDPNKGSIQLC